MTRVAVFGAGSGAPRSAKVRRRRRLRLMLYADASELAEAITEKGENADYLPGIRLAGRRCARRPIRRAAGRGEIVVLAVPSQSLRGSRGVGPTSPAGRLPDEGHRAPHDRRRATSSRRSPAPGRTGSPSFGRPRRRCRRAAGDADRVLGSPTGRRPCRPPATRRTSAVHESAWSAASSAGRRRRRAGRRIAEGLGFGDNTRASLITRGLAETARLGMELGADADDVRGPRRAGRPPWRRAAHPGTRTFGESLAGGCRSKRCRTARA